MLVKKKRETEIPIISARAKKYVLVAFRNNLIVLFYTIGDNQTKN